MAPKRRNVLKWINSFDCATQQDDFIHRRQRGTGQWLLDSAEFREWIENNQRTLFCPGIAGAGKTILTSIVVEELTTRFESDVDIGIASLYCNYKRQDEQKPVDLFANIIKQIVQKQRIIPDILNTLHDRYKGKPTRPSLDEILEVLQSIIKMCSKVIIIVDAIDECPIADSYRQKFLSSLFMLQDKFTINLFITSRPMLNIEKEFVKCTRLEIRVNEEDVKIYLENNMIRLPSFVVLDIELQEEIKISILEATNGMFLLASLYFESLIGLRSITAIRVALKNLTTNSDIYNHIYENYMKRVNGQLEDHKILAKQVLLLIICSKRPLTILELQHALAVEIGEPELDEENISKVGDIVSACVGLVTIDEESQIIRFIHHTTQEYFDRTRGKWFPDAESDITTICVTYMSFRVFEAGYCQTDEEFEARLRLRPFYSYAARYWGDHARAVSADVGHLILDFLKNEAMVSSSYQALVASRQSSDHQGYCQKAPKRVTGLHLAVYFGLEQVTARLCSELQPTCKDSNDQTPLWWAAEKGSEPIMKLLNQRDRVTLPILVQEGKQDLIKSIVRAGYNVNSKGYGNRTLLHDAISSRSPDLVDVFISAGADFNSEDSNGMTPLQMAVQLKHLDLVELLLKRSATAKSVTIDDWRSLYGKQESVTVKLLEGPGQEKCVQFVQEGELQGELMNPPHRRGTHRRLLLFTDNSPWDKGWINAPKTNLQRNKINIHEWSNDQNCTHSVTVWFSAIHGQESKGIFKVFMEEKIRITWTMMWLENSNGEPYCKSVDHFSTLKDVSIPDHSLQFFICLIRHLKEKWLELCYLAQKHITQCRRDVLDGKGEEPELINRLLEDAQKWTEFRSYVRDQVDAARKFGVGYSRRYQEEIALRELRTILNEFEKDVNVEIDSLDKSSESLIEIEFNLVSINEARRSTSMSASMKRLSWITFVFLPAMFVSSLFGMNVNILKDNPDWRWYLLFGGACLTLTLIGWLGFKYIPIETWIEHKAHYIQRRLGGRLPRADVESAGKPKRRSRAYD